MLNPTVDEDLDEDGEVVSVTPVSESDFAKEQLHCANHQGERSWYVMLVKN